VTPTFAAGLGVVVAAVLAFQMGMPSFRVSVPRWTGQRCGTPGCASAPAGSGPAAATGGQHLPVPSPAPGSPGARGAVPAARPVVTYQTERSWPGGFQGHLTLSFGGAPTPGHWWMRFTYPAGHLQRVWGPVRWQAHGGHSAVVGAPAGSAGQRAGGRDIQIWFQVTGAAGRPHGCSFNHVACHFG
jgi:hypothetical protein